VISPTNGGFPPVKWDCFLLTPLYRECYGIITGFTVSPPWLKPPAVEAPAGGFVFLLPGSSPLTLREERLRIPMEIKLPGKENILWALSRFRAPVRPASSMRCG